MLLHLLRVRKCFSRVTETFLHFFLSEENIYENVPVIEVVPDERDKIEIETRSVPTEPPENTILVENEIQQEAICVPTVNYSEQSPQCVEGAKDELPTSESKIWVEEEKLQPTTAPIAQDKDVVEIPNKSIASDSFVVGNENLSDFLIDAPDESILRVEDSEEKKADFALDAFFENAVDLRPTFVAPPSLSDEKGLSYVSDFDSEGGAHENIFTGEKNGPLEVTTKEVSASIYEDDFDMSSHIQSKLESTENVDVGEPVKRSKNQEDDIREESLAQTGSLSYYEDFDDVDEELFEV